MTHFVICLQQKGGYENENPYIWNETTGNRN